MEADRVGQPSVTLAGAGAMPLLGFGTWRLSGAECYRAVRHALDVGYRHLDTATIYRNEHEVGRAVHDSGLAREDVFVATKLPPDQAGRERRTLEASLEALGTPYVDLWLIHWPPKRGSGEATWREFVRLREGGTVRAIGVSNYDAAQLDALAAATGVMPQVNQIRWAPSLHDPATVEAHRVRGVVLEGYSPFRSSDLGDGVLAEIAGRHGVTPAQVIIRWHLHHEIVVIPRSKTPARIEENADVFDFSLSAEEVRRIDSLAG